MKRILLAFCLAVPLGVFAQGKDAKPAEPKPQPGVNWSGQVLRATGAGAPDLKAQNPAQARLGAESAARADALRNLLSQVKGVSVDGTKKMGDLMEKDEVRLRVEGVVKGFKVVKEVVEHKDLKESQVQFKAHKEIKDIKEHKVQDIRDYKELLDCKVIKVILV